MKNLFSAPVLLNSACRANLGLTSTKIPKLVLVAMWMFLFMLTHVGATVAQNVTISTCATDCFTFKGNIDYKAIGNSMSYAEDRSNCGQKPNSSATFTLPAGATVYKAYLIWSGSGAIDHTVSLNGQSISAQKTFTNNTNGDIFFAAYADATNLVHGSGTYTVSDLQWSNIDRYCYYNAAYGAWSLVIIYEDTNTTKICEIQLCMDKFRFTFPAGNYSSTINCIQAPTNCPSNAKMTIIAFEGDGYKGEWLGIGGQDYSWGGIIDPPNAAGLGNNFRGQTAPNLDILTYNVNHLVNGNTSSLSYVITSYTGNTTWGNATEGLFDFAKILKYDARSTVGATCDDGNALTENDVILTDGCTCAGQIDPCKQGPDTDGDGIKDNCDCDDDNDGILDIDEIGISLQNGDFSEAGTSWVSSNTTFFNNSAIFKADDDNPSSPDGYFEQTVTGLSCRNQIELTFDATRFRNSGAHHNHIYVSLNGILYLEIANTGTNSSLPHGVKAMNGATVNVSSFPSDIPQPIKLTIPYSAVNKNTATLRFLAQNCWGCASSIADFKIDNIAISECDFDNDGIPNRLDNDSDNDGCPDAIEGNANYGLADVDAQGRLKALVSSCGLPGSTPQTIGTSQNSTIKDPDCVPKGSIGDMTYCDNNNNGIMDAGDTPAAGVQVTLCNAANVVINTAITDGQGKYIFSNLAAGIYIVKFPTTITGGKTIITQNPITVNLASGQDFLDADAGYKPSAPLPTITINDITVTEGANPTATIQICAFQVSTSPISVQYATSNGSATSGADYSSNSGIATIPAGQTCTTVTFPIIDDNVIEPTEQFNVNLTNPTGATIADPLGTVTILDNDQSAPLPNITINDITVTEGTNPTATLQICISEASTNPTSVTCTTANGTAVAGSDYTTKSATVIIPAGQTCATVSFDILDDNINEPTESFNVNLTNPSGATIADGLGMVTILDNDTNGGGTPDCNAITFDENNGKITVTGLTAPIVMLQIFNSAWQTVTNDIYYNSPGIKSTATLPAGSYYVKATLLNASWGTICVKDATVIVVGGGTPVLPSLNINDVTVNENAGTASVQICLSAVSNQAVTATYTTANGSALVGSDYTAKSAIVTIPAGQTCATVSFDILDDNINEPTESFNVNLTNPSGATIADGLGMVTILDNDTNGGGTPDCNAITFDENNGKITVTGLTAPIVMLQIFNSAWQTVTNDIYYDSPGIKSTATLPAGSYYVKATLLNASWGTICVKDATVIVVGGGTPVLPSLNINDVTVNENEGTASVQICLSAVSNQAVSATYTTANGSALAASDYSTKSATVTIPAGQTCATVSFDILDDNNNEPTESFNVNLTNPSGATIADGLGTVTILDNDTNGGGTPDCSNITFTGSNGQISLTGLTAPIVMLQIFNSAWQTVTNEFYSNSPGGKTITSLPAGQYYVKVTLLNATWGTICIKDGYVNVGSGTGTCSNVTNGGQISGDQTVCATQGPATIGSISAANGGNGALEYMWIFSTTNCPEPNGSATQIVSGANGETYTPGPLVQTTWFRRCARRTGCTEWSGESNCVKITVSGPCAPGGGTADCSAISITPGSNNLLVQGLNAPIVMIQVFDSKWSKVFECMDNGCSKPSTNVNNLTPGQYFVKVDFLNASWQPICKKEQFVNVVQALATPTQALSFKAYKKQTESDLRWVVNTTSDKEAFVVERAEKGGIFTPIGTMVIVPDQLNFRFTDSKPLAGDNNYRLKVMLLDGSYIYSAIENLQFADFSSIRVYPNPAYERLFINLGDATDKETRIEIMDARGNILRTLNTSSTDATVEMELNDLANGLYFVRISLEGMREITQKVVIDSMR